MGIVLQNRMAQQTSAESVVGTSDPGQEDQHSQGPGRSLCWDLVCTLQSRVGAGSFLRLKDQDTDLGEEEAGLAAHRGPFSPPRLHHPPRGPTEEGRRTQLGVSWAGASEGLGAVLGPLPLWPASLDQTLRMEVSNSLPETDTHSLGDISEAPPLLTLKDSPPAS